MKRFAGNLRIADAVSLKDLGEVVSAESMTRVVLAETEEDARLGNVLQSRPGDVALAVGPEGGWADGELAWFLDEGWVAASLGNTILRAETAAIVACALVMDATR